MLDFHSHESPGMTCTVLEMTCAWLLCMPAYFFGILLQSNRTLAVSEHGDLAGNICHASEGYSRHRSIYISSVPISIHVFMGSARRDWCPWPPVRTLHHSRRFGVTHGHAAER